jgi:hypothetical protein
MLWLNKYHIIVYVFLFLFFGEASAQCLLSLNPVGGTENLLTLEKNSMRVISFYKYGSSKQYYQQSKPSDFNLIDRAYYNYLSATLAYGLTGKLTLESDIGYFINKSQVFNTQPRYTLSGSGLSNIIVSAKYNFYTNHSARMYYSAALGAKIPASTKPKMSGNVQLPVDLQSTIGALGMVFNSIFVKESSEKSLRVFITNRMEANLPNSDNYKLGTALTNSLYVSKHLRAQWIKGDWTAIFQMRNEIRTRDIINGMPKEASGSVLFFAVPQINYVIGESFYLSVMADIPVYQYFNGTQMEAGHGFTISLSRAFSL